MFFEISWSLQSILILIALSLSALLITYSVRQSSSCPVHTPSEPPIASYRLPYLQHLVSFLSDPGTLYRTAQAHFRGPFTLLMMNTKFHVFYAQETANYIFSRSRAFTFDPVMASMMQNALDLPPADLAMFLPSREGGGKEKADSRYFVKTNHGIWQKYLAGENLDAVMKVYMANFQTVLDEHMTLTGTEWKTMDFHELMRRLIFETSAATFFGPRIRRFWPDMWADWKEWDAATYVGVRSNFAYSLRPGAGRARERMLKAFERWVDCEEIGWEEGEGVWNEVWGVRMNLEREMLARECGFSLRGRACLQASFLFVIVTNAAPMASWFAFCAASTPERLATFRQAASIFPIAAGPNAAQRVDANQLKRNPYIHGLWLEALRLGTASAAARVVTADAVLESYTVRAGSVILLPVELMHYDPAVFPEPREVIPERWMGDDEETLKRQEKAMRPFGGGTSLCSGRFVAEQEIIGVVSTLLLFFDVEYEKGVEWRFDPRSIGVMGPAKAPIVRIRRRVAIM